jgi:hypothetical protein
MAATLDFVSLGALERPARSGGETTLASWLSDGRRVPPKVGLQLITRVGNALADAHQQGIRHGSLSSADVVLSCCSAGSLGVPSLRGFAPSAGAWPRREDVAADVAGLAEIAGQLLLPALPDRGKGPKRARPRPVGRRTRAVAAVIGAGMDRREGVFVFESPVDFVVALEAAMAADAGARLTPDPALVSMHRRRRRRRVLKVLAGAAVACLALLAFTNATATHPSVADRPLAAAASRN